MISAIIAMGVKLLTGPLTDKLADVAKAYIGKQITEAQLKAEIEKAVLSTFAQVEETWANAATAQFESFQQTVRSSRLIQRAVVCVIVSQLAVLLWYQWFASAFLIYTGRVWPSPGTTVDWAYLLLTIAIGGGAYTFRSPGGGMLEKLGGAFGGKK